MNSLPAFFSCTTQFRQRLCLLTSSDPELFGGKGPLGDSGESPETPLQEKRASVQTRLISQTVPGHLLVPQVTPLTFSDVTAPDLRTNTLKESESSFSFFFPLKKCSSVSSHDIFPFCQTHDCLANKEPMLTKVRTFYICFVKALSRP